MLKQRSIFWIVIILAITLSLRALLFLGILLRNPVFFSEGKDGYFLTNSDGYWKLAGNIVNNKFFSIDNIRPEHIRTPLYPLYLALLKWSGLNAASIIFTQVIISSVTCLVVIILAYRLTGDWPPACLGGALVAVDLPSIVLSNLPMTETLFTFLFALSILYLILYFKRERKLDLLLSGALMGLSILCRPIATYFPFFSAILILAFSKTPRAYIFRGIVAYLFSCLLVLSPWLIRNQILFGSPFVSTIGYASFPDRISRFSSTDVPLYKERDTSAEVEKLDDNKPVGLSRFKVKRGIKAALEHPVICFRGFLRSVSFMLFKPIRSDIDLQLGFSKEGNTLTPWSNMKAPSSLLTRLFQQTSRFTIALVFIQIPLLAILWISFIYGMGLTLAKKEYPIFWTIGTIFLYCSVTVSEPARFRVPLVPFIAIGSGIGIYGALPLWGIRHIGQYGRFIAIKRELKRLNFTNVLDAGCGVGLYSKYIISRYPNTRLTALDFFDTIFKKEIESNAKLRKRITFIKKNLTEIAFRNKFDLILNINALGRVINDEKTRRSILEKFYNALRDGGILLLHSGKGLRAPGGLKREFIVEDMKKIGFKIEAVKYTFGILGTLAWDIYLMVDKYKLIKLLILPFLKLILQVDSKIVHKSGNGLLIIGKR